MSASGPRLRVLQERGKTFDMVAHEHWICGNGQRCLRRPDGGGEFTESHRQLIVDYCANVASNFEFPNAVRALLDAYDLLNQRRKG